MRFTSDAQRRAVFAALAPSGSKLHIKNGHVSLVPRDRINDPSIGLGYLPRTLERWKGRLGDKPVLPLILRPAYLDQKQYTIWDGRHTFAWMEMEGWPLIPARIYEAGRLVYPKEFKKQKLDGDETTRQRLGEEYKYLW